MAEGVVIGGQSHKLIHPLTGKPISVLGPKDHGMEFKPGDGYNHRRLKPITHGVIHWTGSENPVETMFETLKKRKLGVEYAIAPHGVLYQFCDMEAVDTADAGEANKISWGVEIVNAGFRRASTLWMEPRYRKIKMGPRASYNTRIRGAHITCWDFYPEQTATMCALNKLIADKVPTYGKEVCTSPDLVDWRQIRGAVGHYQLDADKFDPGTLPLEHLAYFMKTGKLPDSVIAALQIRAVLES
jgi:hypothetical protein